MKRAQYTERGPDPQASIEAVEFTLPELAAGQALVEVLAAPINPSDVLTLTGLYGMLPPLPAVGGNEGVGKVVALGPDTKGPPVGQTVLLPVGCGSWATHIVAEAKADIQKDLDKATAKADAEIAAKTAESEVAIGEIRAGAVELVADLEAVVAIAGAGPVENAVR